MPWKRLEYPAPEATLGVQNEGLLKLLELVGTFPLWLRVGN